MGDDYVYVVVNIGARRISKELRTIDEAMGFLKGVSEFDVRIIEDERLRTIEEIGNKLYAEFHAYQTPLSGRGVLKACSAIVDSVKSGATNEPCAAVIAREQRGP
jgi:hypothetical protein